MSARHDEIGVFLEHTNGRWYMASPHETAKKGEYRAFPTDAEAIAEMREVALAAIRGANTHLSSAAEQRVVDAVLRALGLSRDA